MTWFTYLLLAILFLVLHRYFNKNLLNNKSLTPGGIVFLFYGTGLFILLILGLIRGFHFSQFSDVIVNVLIAGFSHVLVSLLLTYAYKKDDMSNVVVMLGTSPLFTVVASWFFLGQSLSLKQIVGITILLIGVVIISLEGKKHWQLSTGVILGLCAAIIYGLNFTNDAYVMYSGRDIITYIFLIFLISTLVSIVFFYNESKQLLIHVNLIDWLQIIFMTVFFLGHVFFVFLIVSLGTWLVITAPLLQLATPLSVLFAIVCLHEKRFLKNKLLGSLLTFIGSALILL
jgi:drug/metabolite transporter (DMT)-like permease